MSAMKIRLVQFSLGPGSASEARAIADKLVPAIRAQPGCERCEFFIDDDIGYYGFVVFWASQQAAEDASLVISPILLAALAGATGLPSIRLLDVYEPG